MADKSTLEMGRKELEAFFSEYAGKLIGEAVEQAVATRTSALEKRQTDWFEKLHTAGALVPVKETPRADGKPKNTTGPVIRCLVNAKGDVERAVLYAKRMYPQLVVGEEGETLPDFFSRSAKALGTNDGPGGGFITPATMSAEIIGLLYPQSIIRQAGATVVQMPHGNLRIPKLTGGATATYIGENANIVASQQTFGQIVMSFKKLAALVAISNDLIRFSSPSADDIVRDDIVRQIASAENAAFLRSDGTASTPKGIRYWASAGNVIATTGTYATLANLVADLGLAMLALINANVPITRGAFFMSPRTWWRFFSAVATTGQFIYRDELSRGTLLGYPVYRSTQIPTTLGSGALTELYFVDMADVIIGEAKDIRVDASTEAAYIDANGQMVAAYSQDQTVIRAIAEHDIALRRGESLAVITGVDG